PDRVDRGICPMRRQVPVQAVLELLGIFALHRRRHDPYSSGPVIVRDSPGPVTVRAAPGPSVAIACAPGPWTAWMRMPRATAMRTCGAAPVTCNAPTPGSATRGNATDGAAAVTTSAPVDGRTPAGADTVGAIPATSNAPAPARTARGSATDGAA